MIVREVVIPANERVTIPLGYVPQWIMVTINSGVVDFVFGTETETPPITLNAVQTIKLRNYPVRDKCTFIEKVGLEARCYLYLLDAENEADQTGVAVNPLTKTPEGGLIIAGDVTITGKLRVNQSTQLDTTLFIPLKLNVGLSGVLESYAGVDVYASVSTADVPLLRLRTEGTRTVVSSTRTGSGSYLPLAFDTGGAERLRIGTDGTTVISGVLRLTSPSDQQLTLMPGGSAGGAQYIRNWEGQLIFYHATSSAQPATVVDQSGVWSFPDRLTFSTQTGRIDLDNSGYRRIETVADGSGGFYVRIANSLASNPSPFCELYDATSGAPRIRFYVSDDPWGSTSHLRMWDRGIRFRQGAGDEMNAGTIAYRRFTTSLDIVGAGSSPGSRVVSIFDRLSFPEYSAPQISMGSGSIIDVRDGGGGIGVYDAALPLKVHRGMLITHNATYGSVVFTAHPGGHGPLFTFRPADNPSISWLLIANDGRVVVPQSWARLDAYGILRESNWGYADGEVNVAGGNEVNNVGPEVSLYTPTSCKLMIVATGVVRSTSSANTNGIVWIRLNGGRVRGKRIWCSGANDNHSFALTYLANVTAGTHTVNLDFRADTPGWNTAIGSREVLIFAMNTQT